MAADRMHFHQAAERLHLSQPTVTAHIAGLERELGAKLFVRGGRKLTLTPAGEHLLPYARQMVELQEGAERELTSWTQGYNERLRIISSIFVAGSVLPSGLRRLLSDRPGLDISLRTAFSAEVVAAIAAGEADLGLSRVDPVGAGITAQRLSSESVVLAAPASWGGEETQKVLGSRYLLTHNHPGYWDRLLADLRLCGVRYRTLEVRQVDVTKRLILEGLGCSFLPASAVREEVASGVFALLPPPQGLELPQVGTYAVLPAGRPVTAATAALVQLLADS